ncbi:hypothetical protein A1D31_38670 [Bradyrhizobium liaoningense]|nr:hypothetical protein A1D31_38670 [Bradyrhizobium liaoningense]
MRWPKGRRGEEVCNFAIIANRADQIDKLAKKRGKSDPQVSLCYEAGLCRYGLHRQLKGLGHGYLVVVSSLIPMKAGDRVKTDRRDAAVPAELHRSGGLTALWVRMRRMRHARPVVRRAPIIAVNASTSLHSSASFTPFGKHTLTLAGEQKAGVLLGSEPRTSSVSVAPRPFGLFVRSHESTVRRVIFWKGITYRVFRTFRIDGFF